MIAVKGLLIGMLSSDAYDLRGEEINSMSNPGQEGKTPSVAELQRFIKDGERLTFKTVDGGSYTGKLRWFDEQAFCLALDHGEFTLVKSNVIGYGVARKK